MKLVYKKNHIPICMLRLTLLFQLSELESRVVDAESRAESAEQQVRLCLCFLLSTTQHMRLSRVFSSAKNRVDCLCAFFYLQEIKRNFICDDIYLQNNRCYFVCGVVYLQITICKPQGMSKFTKLNRSNEAQSNGLCGVNVDHPNLLKTNCPNGRWSNGLSI